MCSRKCCLALGLYQYHRPTAYREGVSLGFVLCLYSDDCIPQICFFYICLPLFHLVINRGAETRGRGDGEKPAFRLKNVVFLLYFHGNDDFKNFFKICPTLQNRQNLSLKQSVWVTILVEPYGARNGYD